MSTQPPNQLPNEAVPLPEQPRPYVPSPEVEALIPKAPEVLPGPNPNPRSSPPVNADPAASVPSVSVTADGVGGMIIAPEGGIVDEIKLRSIVDPFDTPTIPRVSAREAFPLEQAQQPDGNLLNQFVTPQRLRDLWNQIDALQEDVIQHVRADRSLTDAYQQDLLYASTLLLNSPANYDEAREIVYRVRGDLNRERRVDRDIRRFRPAILIYYGVWLVITLIAFAFDPQFRQLMPGNLPILKLALPPILFAVLGALFNGVMAINEHTTMRRDFDPLYISWYILNPLLGGLLGLVIFIFFVVMGTSFTPNLMTDQSLANAQTPWAIWLLAFIVGWQQNTAVKLLNGFLKTVSGDSKTAAQERPTPTDNAKG